MSDVSSPSNISDLTIKVLENIREELRTLNARIDGGLGELRGELGELRSEVVGLRNELRDLDQRTEAGFSGLRVEVAATNHRLDSLLKIAGTHHGDLEDRVVRIEQHLGLSGAG